MVACARVHVPTEKGKRAQELVPVELFAPVWKINFQFSIFEEKQRLTCPRGTQEVFTIKYYICFFANQLPLPVFTLPTTTNDRYPSWLLTIVDLNYLLLL